MKSWSKEQITELVIYPAVLEVTRASNKSATLQRDTVLFGNGAVLDSLGLVSALAVIEGLIQEHLGTPVVLADEAALSRKRSPFQTIDSLATYIEELLNEESPTSPS